MNESLLGHIIKSIEGAKKYNSNQMVAPKVILWPDPERQWENVLEVFRNEIPALLTFGSFHPEKLQGPAIWIKCMVDRKLPEADWTETTIPIIYMPGVGKEDFRQIEEAPTSIQPLMEYQFTGNLWTQGNGREWTILSFLQNSEEGMGLNVARDKATKEALIKSLPNYLEDPEAMYRDRIDADFLNQLMFPQIIPTLLQWMENGEKALARFPLDQQSAFKDVIRSRYEITLDYSLILDFVRKMGIRRAPWDQVWHYFANAPNKYPNIIGFLRDAKPSDMGDGIFAIPIYSWPQINEESEESLRQGILNLQNGTAEAAVQKLNDLVSEHKERITWVWTELGLSPYADALHHLLTIAQKTIEPYDNNSITAIVDYYQTEGIKIDRALRELYLLSREQNFLEAIQGVVDLCYAPWLEKLTNKFQELVVANPEIFYETNSLGSEASFILFVDAFRYDVASEFVKLLSTGQYEAVIDTAWSALPSVTTTSKPALAPIKDLLDQHSDWDEFKVKMKNGNTLTHHHFKSALKQSGVAFISTPSEIDDPTGRYWMEVGDIDTRGHQEQEAMLRRIPEMLEDLERLIEAIFEQGVSAITIVTDHGWLLLPGGLPKEDLHRDLVETRWGRCALIKEGVDTKLMQLPWSWNPHTSIAYAPGISFFKKNEAYAHGGISLHECLIPNITVRPGNITDGASGRIKSMQWRGMRLNVETSGADESCKMDVRKHADKPKTSIIFNSTKKANNKWNIVVDGDHEGLAVTLVLIDGRGIIVDKKPIFVGE